MHQVFYYEAKLLQIRAHQHFLILTMMLTSYPPTFVVPLFRVLSHSIRPSAESIGHESKSNWSTRIYCIFNSHYKNPMTSGLNVSFVFTLRLSNL